MELYRRANATGEMAGEMIVDGGTVGAGHRPMPHNGILPKPRVKFANRVGRGDNSVCRSGNRIPPEWPPLLINALYDH
jgi:hypothetical protein